VEQLKEKTPMIFTVILAVLICLGAVYFFEYYNAIYYTKIDNSRIEKISVTDDMRYEYTLDCYNEKGKKKEFKFKTSRELREDAYLMLETNFFGVHAWKEVQFNELPDKVKNIYSNN